MAHAGEAGLSISRRETVLWVGEKIPPQLQQVTEILGLTAVPAKVEEINPALPALFGILVSMTGVHGQKAAGRLSRLLRTNLLDYGAMLGIVSANRQEAVEVQRRVVEAVVGVGVDPATGRVMVPTADKFTLMQSIRVMEPTAEELARELRSHNPGLGADLSLDIDRSSCRQELRETDVILLRRAFNGLDRIVLEEQEGGRSEECCVWMVSLFKGEVCYERFVAKAAKRLALQTEFDTFRDVVRHGIAFPFRAPFVDSQFVKGGTRALLVSMFVPRSQRFDRYLASAENPDLVIASLFSVALGPWRDAGRLVSGSTIGHGYIVEQRTAAQAALTAYTSPVPVFLPDPIRLLQAFEDARKVQSDAPNPNELWNTLDQAGPVSFQKCYSHGDLNVRNLFVRWNSMDVILIDFSHAGLQDAMARDPSKLDTSIALTVKVRKRWLSDKVLGDLYRWPLIPPRQFKLVDARTRAIRQIRRQAGGEGITNAEYVVLTACHLLKYAA